MTIECECGNFHGLTPTAMALLIKAYQEGDMQTVGPGGVRGLCMADAFTDERVNDIGKRYPGRAVVFTKGGV